MTDKEESLVAHLEALRSVLIKCFLALGIGFLPCFFLAPSFLNALMKVMAGKTDISFNYFSPMEVFILQIKIAVFLDIIICFPYMARKVWAFVLPALYENERKFIRSVILSSVSLFCIGVLFCVFLILPLIIRFGLSFSSAEIKPVFGLGNVISLSLWLSVVFGVMFQFPLITQGLIKSGLVSYETVKNKRPYIFTGILILSAILTPPDIVSQLMLTIPTYGLFELGLFLSKPKKISE
ncbi:MAG: twin-arginine translocase subunit TatC [Alphaproteobacteria bacterium]|nr:twin-arginine translocase subunit TatC [Alphaproteobacteria bacterium]